MLSQYYIKEHSKKSEKRKRCVHWQVENYSLMFYGYEHLTVDHSKIFAHGRVHINGLEGFWRYAKQNLAKHHGMKADKFPLYAKEME